MEVTKSSNSKVVNVPDLQFIHAVFQYHGMIEFAMMTGVSLQSQLTCAHSGTEILCCFIFVRGVDFPCLSA
jgi:hypothetical protein